jgi:hypothetical protein
MRLKERCPDPRIRRTSAYSRHVLRSLAAPDRSTAADDRHGMYRAGFALGRPAVHPTVSPTLRPTRVVAWVGPQPLRGRLLLHLCKRLRAKCDGPAVSVDGHRRRRHTDAPAGDPNPRSQIGVFGVASVLGRVVGRVSAPHPPPANIFAGTEQFGVAVRGSAWRVGRHGVVQQVRRLVTRRSEMVAGTLELSAGTPAEVTVARHAVEVRLLEWDCGHLRTCCWCSRS